MLLLPGALGLAVAGNARPEPRAALLEEVRRDARHYPGLEHDPHFRAALAAMATLNRADFVPSLVREEAQGRSPLPIGFGQTISAPFIVALMTAAARVGPGSTVLEVGTGSGYQAAVLARAGATVRSVEIVEPLARAAVERMRRLGIPRVSIKAGDGYEGWREHAPYDAVLVTAAAAAIPRPLLDQLKVGGRLVMPVGDRKSGERLLVLTKQADGGFARCSLGPVRFVPLTGKGRSDPRQSAADRNIAPCRWRPTA